MFIVLSFSNFWNIFKNTFSKVKYSCKNYRKKLIYNIYKIEQALKFAIEIVEITIIIK